MFFNTIKQFFSPVMLACEDCYVISLAALHCKHEN